MNGKTGTAWVTGGGFAAVVAVIATFVGYLLPIVQQHPEVPWWLPAVLGALLAACGAIGGGSIALYHLHQEPPAEPEPAKEQASAG